MIQLLLLAILMLIAVYGVREILHAPSASDWRKVIVLIGLLFLFAASLRLGGIIPLLGVLAIMLSRLLPAVLKLAPILRRILQTPFDAKTGAASRPKREGSRMSVEEAYEILGLNPGASREDVIAAHRKLMQKMHPDRGGTDYLAGKVNQARDRLIGS